MRDMTPDKNGSTGKGRREESYPPRPPSIKPVTIGIPAGGTGIAACPGMQPFPAGDWLIFPTSVQVTSDIAENRPQPVVGKNVPVPLLTPPLFAPRLLTPSLRRP
jgi:hypothetical protein